VIGITRTGVEISGRQGATERENPLDGAPGGFKKDFTHLWLAPAKILGDFSLDQFNKVAEGSAKLTGSSFFDLTWGRLSENMGLYTTPVLE
jgi:hypothetical protein